MERRAFPERARAWDRQKSWGVGVRCSGRSTVLRRLRGPLGPEQGRRRVRGRLEHHHHGPSRCLLSRRTGLGPQGAARPCPKTTRPRASVYAEGLRHRSPPVAGWDWLPKDVRMKIATRCGPLTPEPCPLRPSCPPCPPYQLVPRGDGTVVLGVDAHVLVGVGTGQEPGGGEGQQAAPPRSRWPWPCGWALRPPPACPAAVEPGWIRPGGPGRRAARGGPGPPPAHPHQQQEVDALPRVEVQAPVQPQGGEVGAHQGEEATGALGRQGMGLSLGAQEDTEGGFGGTLTGVTSWRV